jgi:hypothetical protein
MSRSPFFIHDPDVLHSNVLGFLTINKYSSNTRDSTNISPVISVIGCTGVVGATRYDAFGKNVLADAFRFHTR